MDTCHSYSRKNGRFINTGKLAQEQCGLVTDRSNMTSAIYRGRKALNQTNNQKMDHLSFMYQTCQINERNCKYDFHIAQPRAAQHA